VRYTTIRVLVVVYSGDRERPLAPHEVAAIERGCEVGRLFYWRNSGCQLHTEVRVLTVPERREVAGDAHHTLHRVAADLQRRGVERESFDAVFDVAPARSGTWSWGVVSRAVVRDHPGAWLVGKGFAHCDYPVPTLVRYPGADPAVDYGVTWIFVHELQHCIDRMYQLSGHGTMWHGDRPFDHPGRCGEHFDYQAQILRRFDGYLALNPAFGAVLKAQDSDGDGLPDDDPQLPMDERRFGSDPLRRDSDDDGLDDLAEFMAGIYRGSDPRAPDSDGDGLADSADPHPLHPLRTEVPRGRPAWEGASLAGWSPVSETLDFSAAPGFAATCLAAWDDEALYLAVRMSQPACLHLHLDGSASGWWQGRDNYEIVVDPRARRPLLRARGFDVSAALRLLHEHDECWSDDPAYPLAPVVHPREVRVSVVGELIKLAIPRSAQPDGFQPRLGGRLGLRIWFDAISGQPGAWATVVEQYRFMQLTLAPSA